MLQDLKIKYDFRTINIDDLSKKIMYNYFFVEKGTTGFIINRQKKLYGIITLNDFLNSKGDIKDSINKNYLFIDKDSEDNVLLKAQKIYNKYHIHSCIPIIDENKIIIGYVYDETSLFRKKADYETLVKKIKEKIVYYKSSYYFQKELDIFLKILKNTSIYIKKCEILNEFPFSQFINSKLQINLLNHEQFYEKVWIERKKDDDMQDKKCLFLDLDFNEISILINNIYSLDKFWNEFSESMENGGYSRVFRIIKNPYYSLIDFIKDHELKDISYPGFSILTKFLSDYFESNGCFFNLDDANIKHGIRASWLINGVRSSNKVFHSFSTCDMLGQQIILNKILIEKRIEILNILPALSANLTCGEKRRFETYGSDLGGLVINQDNASINDLFAEDYREKAVDCAKEFIYSYPVMRRFENDFLVNVDYTSRYINFENGIRRTFYQPEFYNHTIYLLGPCLALGSFVEDKYTIPSLLSKLLIKNNYFYRVVNLGMAMSNDIQELLNYLNIQDGDIVINLLSSEKKYVQKHIDVIETSEAFNKITKRSDMFFDMPLHCNHQGNEIYANVIYEHLKTVLKKEDNLLKKYNIYDVFKVNDKDLDNYKFKETIHLLSREKEKNSKEKKIIGSIVMNANPFTLGHEYLIDYALKRCEWLYLFVVQENQSFFQFEDRFNMILKGCEEKKNISILPSGKMIISNITFPEYFQKETIFNNEDIKQKTISNIALDFRVFSSYIVPALGITKRFVAEEPSDLLTRQYNESMKKVLSAYDIEVIEIPRKTSDDGEVISASVVRRLYRKKNYKEMEKLVPKSTLDFLINNENKYIIDTMKGRI